MSKSRPLLPNKAPISEPKNYTKKTKGDNFEQPKICFSPKKNSGKFAISIIRLYLQRNIDKSTGIDLLFRTWGLPRTSALAHP